MSPPDLNTLYDGIRQRDRSALGRALTLVESDRADHRDLAQELLARLLPHTGAAKRVGITGSPGVGKSTFIDRLGMHLIGLGHRVAVIAVDPTSTRSGGSILGDKTRMSALSRQDEAFIRPSPSRGALGGVARKSRESRIVLEAAGFDVLLVETVGVGQSETEVAEMVDHFVVLLLPNAGDALQGIKRGVLELADLLVVHKADGDLANAARRTRDEHLQAMRLLRPRHAEWTPPVISASSVTGDGIDEVWERVRAHREMLERLGYLERTRAEQSVGWMWRVVDYELSAALRADPDVVSFAHDLERDVRESRVPPTRAALDILHRFRQRTD